MVDTPKLCKLLEQTTSDNDAEALASIRLANQMLLNAHTTWTDLLGQQLGEEPFEPDGQSHLKEVAELLAHPNMNNDYRRTLMAIMRRFEVTRATPEDVKAISRIRVALAASER